MLESPKSSRAPSFCCGSPLPAEFRSSQNAKSRVKNSLDHYIPHGLNIWVVADNLRKGAATNAVQIAEVLVERGWLPRR